MWNVKLCPINLWLVCSPPTCIQATGTEWGRDCRFSPESSSKMIQKKNKKKNLARTEFSGQRTKSAAEVMQQSLTRGRWGNVKGTRSFKEPPVVVYAALSEFNLRTRASCKHPDTLTVRACGTGATRESERVKRCRHESLVRVWVHNQKKNRSVMPKSFACLPWNISRVNSAKCWIAGCWDGDACVENSRC